MSNWNKIDHISKMKPLIEKLTISLLKKGINFKEFDGTLENVVFSNGKKELKLSHHLFYRFSGIARIYKDDKEKNQTISVKVDDEMFIMSFMKPIVESFFDLEIKSK